jgi:hypothetical protein
MKPAQYFALSSGIFYLILGIFGLLPNVIQGIPSANLTVDPDVTLNFDYLFGVLPTNNMSSSISAIIGISGIVTAFSLGSARAFSGLLGVLMTVGTVMGLIPFAQTFFGLTPLFGFNVWLHGITAVLAIYFGFVKTPDLLQLWSKEASSLQ